MPTVTRLKWKPIEQPLQITASFGPSLVDPAYQVPIGIAYCGKRVSLTGRRWYWTAKLIRLLFRKPMRLLTES
jgi:hypothetical protein